MAQKRLFCQPCIGYPLEDIASFHYHYKTRGDNKMYIDAKAIFCKTPNISSPCSPSVLDIHFYLDYRPCIIYRSVFSFLAFFCYNHLISSPFPLSFTSAFPFSLGPLSFSSLFHFFATFM